MPYYNTCPHCGSNLDPGEPCECNGQSKPDFIKIQDYVDRRFEKHVPSELIDEALPAATKKWAKIIAKDSNAATTSYLAQLICEEITSTAFSEFTERDFRAKKERHAAEASAPCNKIIISDRLAFVNRERRHKNV